MFINSTGFYIPEERVPNSHFLELNGLTDEWIRQRTGIVTRSRAGKDENHNTMGLNAIDDAIKALPYDVKDVDLIVSAAYAPYDTVATLAHIAQRKYAMDKARAVYASSACSSFVNGLEIIEGYFASGKATKALLVCSEHNTYYANETDKVCGHLWGDAAVAFFVSKDRVADTDCEIKTIYTRTRPPRQGSRRRTPPSARRRHSDARRTRRVYVCVQISCKGSDRSGARQLH